MTKKFSMVRGRVLRATRLDGCGNPVLGPDSAVVSKGFIQVSLSAVNDAGTVISITNAAGEICILDTPAPKFTNFTLEIQFCGVDPNLYNITSGQPVVYNDAATPEAIGFKVNSGVNIDNKGFALELWSSVPTDFCEEGAAESYGYILIPFIKGGTIGDFTVANDAVNFTLTGAATKDGTSWGVGPFNVQLTAAGAPSPLFESADPKDHLQVFVTSLAPPEAADEPAAVGVPATSAVAGIPGTYLPANSYGRANLVGMTGLTASPNTAWTVGQYVTMRDGNKAHWSGTLWVAGPA